MTDYQKLIGLRVPVETSKSRAAWALEKVADALSALPKPTYTVRDMTPEDVPHLLQIENASFKDEAYPERVFANWQAAGGAVKVADVGGKPVGYIMHRDDPDMPGYRYGTSLAVHPDHRRGGVGEALMTDLVRNHPQISADVDSTNKASKGLLKKLKFKSKKVVREGGKVRHRMVLDKPYRDRAELYAMKDGMVYGSKFPHGGFGVYGGGIDPGEEPSEAAAREFAEEAGWNVKNVKELPFEPHTLDWKPPFSEKTLERAKEFRGSRTRYFVGDLADKIPNAKLDELGRKDARLYHLDEALGLAEPNLTDADLVAANKKRAAVLAHLKEYGLQKVAFESAPAEYEPKLYLVKRAADEEEDRPFTICVDLDGTLAEQEKPFNRESIGEPIDRAIEWVRLFHENGARIIIFTVRGDDELVKEWLDEHEVPYDYVNENPDQPPDSSGKVFADVYWDDRGYNAVDPDENGPTILRKVLAHNGEDEEAEEPEHGPSPMMRIDRTVITISGPMLLECMEDEDDEGTGDD